MKINFWKWTQKSRSDLKARYGVFGVGGYVYGDPVKFFVFKRCLNTSRGVLELGIGSGKIKLF
jgi:hypothetical protein